MMLAEGAELLDHHDRGRQHRHRDREHVTPFGTIQDRPPRLNAVDAVQHVHDGVAGASLEDAGQRERGPFSLSAEVSLSAEAAPRSASRSRAQ
jgi:hypothetical protein